MADAQTATVPFEPPLDGKSRVPKPSHVPDELVREIDMFGLDGIEEGYHEAWYALKTQPGMPELVWTPLTGGHWIAMDGSIVREVYKDYERFSSEVIFMPKEAGEKYAMVPTRMDPPEHTPYRKLLDSGLNPAHIRRIEDYVRQTAVEIIDSFLERGRCEFDSEFGRVFPVRVFMKMCDLPLEDVPYLSTLVDDMTRPPGKTPEEQAAALDAANQAFFQYVEPYLDDRTGGSGEDLITLYANGKVNGEPIARDKALGMVALLLLGGLDTVLNFLSFTMLYLARNPDKVAEVRGDDLKLRRGIEELFRRFPIVAEARMVAKDQTYRGVELKRGEMLLIPTVMDSLDEIEHPNPFEVQWDRKSHGHSSFGQGAHRCVGMHLARMEATITLQEWLKRIPEFRLAPGAKPVFKAGITAVCESVPLEWDVPAQA